jgi:hypothetical protein
MAGYNRNYGTPVRTRYAGDNSVLNEIGYQRSGYFKVKNRVLVVDVDLRTMHASIVEIGAYRKPVRVRLKPRYDFGGYRSEAKAQGAMVGQYGGYAVYVNPDYTENRYRVRVYEKKTFGGRYK